MIQSCKCKDTEKIFNRIFSKKFPKDIQLDALYKIRMLNRGTILNDLEVPPSNRLEPLKGDRKGQYSFRINGQWKICSIWLNGEALGVEVVDYH